VPEPLEPEPLVEPEPLMPEEPEPDVLEGVYEPEEEPAELDGW
jgi:hypothetical protein